MTLTNYQVVRFEWGKGRTVDAILLDEVCPLFEIVTSLLSPSSIDGHSDHKIVFYSNTDVSELESALGIDTSTTSVDQYCYYDKSGCELWNYSIYKSEPYILCKILPAFTCLKEKDPAIALGEERYLLQKLKFRCFLVPIFLRLQQAGGLIFHCGLVSLNGCGVLLAGPSNFGKTTACSRLPDSWNVLCDDLAIIAQDTSGKVWGYPFPTLSHYREFGFHPPCDIYTPVPLNAIFFLEKSDRDEIVPLTKNERLARVMQVNTEINRSFGDIRIGIREHYLDSAMTSAIKLTDAVPMNILKLSLTGKFWEQMENVL